MTTEDLIPSLHFTKAELAYVLAVLTPSVSPTDDFTKMDMLEIRHYINLIKDKVAMSISDGSLKKALAALVPPVKADLQIVATAASGNGKEAPSQEGVENGDSTEERFPTMDELKKKFPSLTVAEIREIVGKVKAERERKELAAMLEKTEERNATPPPPSFIVQPKSLNGYGYASPERLAQDKANSQRFASMLGEV